MAVQGIKERQLIIDTVASYKDNQATIGEVMSAIDMYMLNSNINIPFDVVTLLKVLKFSCDADVMKEAKNLIEKYGL